MTDEILSPQNLTTLVRIHDRKIVQLHYTIVLLSKVLGIPSKQMDEIIKLAQVETERAVLKLKNEREELTND